MPATFARSVSAAFVAIAVFGFAASICEGSAYAADASGQSPRSGQAALIGALADDSALGELVGQGTCGAKVQFAVYCAPDGTYCAVVSGDGPMADYQYAESPFSKDYPYIDQVIVRKGVTSIGASSFVYCSNLAKATLPEGLSGIGENAFCDCAFTSVDIPAGVTRIDRYAFHNSKLRKVVIPSTVKSIGAWAFGNCHEITSLVIGSGVKTIGECAFASAYKLKSIAIPDSVTKLGDCAFGGCESATSLKIGKGVKVIPYECFQGCRKLKKVAIPNGVTKIGESAFDRCRKLKSVSVPASVKRIGDGAFAMCLALKKIAIPKTAKLGRLVFEDTNTKVLYKSYSAKSGKPARASIAKLSSTARTVTVRWKKIATAAGYQVQLSEKAGFAKPKTATIKKAGAASATMRGLGKGKKYYVRIRAYRKSGSVTTYGAWSSSKSVETR